MQEYINSGILETYVLGCATEQEAKEVLYMMEKHPEVRDALRELEADMERIAGNMAITPPAGTWNKIEKEIDEIELRTPREPAIYSDPGQKAPSNKPTSDYIDIESESTHMRVHKGWKWVLLAIFVLGKIFLGFAIYYYFESRQAKEQVQDLKTELKQLKSN
ncbi:hypothetical protein DJ568_01720 [Mucilaginibacter hurinus]|uniref:Anti-sigma factor n=1 Tax=Mucilaginibacter hurinus TaxID=2201324 RepID=A0A367GVB4_9SPHI|nr:hypothetical protein [Mucilaginibacter hurinus]RCH56603.1 hypothetical protein DJ568_01720 [Mucilaginibacter hurinus]